MFRKKNIISTPAINEITFNYLHTMDAEGKSRLSTPLLKSVKTAKRARAWVENATLDEKLIVLLKLGAKFSFILHKQPLDTKRLKDLQRLCEEAGRERALKMVCDENFIVVGDRTLMNYLVMLSHDTNGNNYLINLDYHKVGQYVNNWEMYAAPSQSMMQESSEMAAIINRFALHACLGTKRAEGLHGLLEIDVLMLMFLYTRRTKETSRMEIDSWLVKLYKKNTVTACLNRLGNKLFVDLGVSKRNQKYQITSLGIEKLFQFHKQNLDRTV